MLPSNTRVIRVATTLALAFGAVLVDLLLAAEVSANGPHAAAREVFSGTFWTL